MPGLPHWLDLLVLCVSCEVCSHVFRVVVVGLLSCRPISRRRVSRTAQELVTGQNGPFLFSGLPLGLSATCLHIKTLSPFGSGLGPVNVFGAFFAGFGLCVHANSHLILVTGLLVLRHQDANVIAMVTTRRVCTKARGQHSRAQRVDTTRSPSSISYFPFKPRSGKDDAEAGQ